MGPAPDLTLKVETTAPTHRCSKHRCVFNYHTASQIHPNTHVAVPHTSEYMHTHVPTHAMPTHTSTHKHMTTSARPYPRTRPQACPLTPPQSLRTRAHTAVGCRTNRSPPLLRTDHSCVVSHTSPPRSSLPSSHRCMSTCWDRRTRLDRDTPPPRHTSARHSWHRSSPLHRCTHPRHTRRCRRRDKDEPRSRSWRWLTVSQSRRG